MVDVEDGQGLGVVTEARQQPHELRGLPVVSSSYNRAQEALEVGRDKGRHAEQRGYIRIDGVHTREEMKFPCDGTHQGCGGPFPSVIQTAPLSRKTWVLWYSSPAFLSADNRF